MANAMHLDMARVGRETWNAFVNAQGSDFRADLTGATLSKAKLARANLRAAHLADIGLRQADLTGARLSLADLQRADLTGANLRGAQLSGADLRDANLSGVNLNRADLSGADLRRAKLVRTVMTGTDLTETDLRRADLSACRELDRARLRDARYGPGTRWPVDFDPATAGAVLDDDRRDDSSEEENRDGGNDEPDPRGPAGPVRLPALGQEAQIEVRRQLEPVSGQLQRLAMEDMSLDEEEQAYLRGQLGTLREQLRLDYDGDTRIIELAIANITTRFADRLRLGDEVRAILIEIGTRPPDLIEEIIDRLNRELTSAGTLGAADPVEDAATLNQIGSSMDQLEELVASMIEQMDDHVVQSDSRQRTMTRGFFGGLATSLAASGVEGSWQGVAVRLLTALQEIVRWLTSTV